MKEFLENLFLRSTGYAYSNLARLFLRLFVGVMFIQFGIRHLINFSSLRDTFPVIIGLDSETSLILMICIEILCSLFIMAGFLTRIAVLPPIIAMSVAEYYILHDMLPDTVTYTLSSTQPGYLPLMFIGVFIFFIIAGPGKISLDYFISLFIIARRGKDERDELEEV